MEVLAVSFEVVETPAAMSGSADKAATSASVAIVPSKAGEVLLVFSGAEGVDSIR